MTTEERLDDWAQTNGSLGSFRDKSVGLEFMQRPRLPHTQLTALYAQSALLARIVDRVVDDALKNGWYLEGFEPDEWKTIKSKCKRIGLDAKLSQLFRWSRLYGAAGMSVPVVDGCKASRPVRRQTARQMFAPSVFTEQEITAGDMDVGFGSPSYLRVMNYDLTPAAGGRSIKMHRDRLIIAEPIPLPYQDLVNLGWFWGPSVLERIYAEFARDGSTQQHAAAMMFIASILYMQIEGYRAEHSTKGGKERIKKILEATRRNLDSLGILGLDAKDSLGALNISDSGAAAMLDRFRDSLAAVSPMPREILLNESPAGLNAGQLSGPQEIWFAHVGAWQVTELEPVLRRFLDVALWAWGFGGREFEVKFSPLWTRSEESTSEIQAKNAASDKLYFDMGALDAEEIRSHRFRDGRLDPVHLEEDEPIEALPLEEVPEEPTAKEGPKVADEAMNGAQVASLVGIVEKVSLGALPRDAAIEIIGAAFPSVAHRANAILGSAGMQTQAPATDEEEGQSQDPMPEDLASPRDIAQRLAIPTVAVTNAIKRGELRYWGIGKHKRVSLAEVAELSKAHEQTTEEE